MNYWPDHAQKSEIIRHSLHRCSSLQSSHAQTSSMLVTWLRTFWFTPKNTMALAVWAKSIWLYQCPDLPGFTTCWHAAISQMFRWKVNFKWFQYVYNGFHCIGLRERRKSLQIWSNMIKNDGKDHGVRFSNGKSCPGLSPGAAGELSWNPHALVGIPSMGCWAQVSVVIWMANGCSSPQRWKM